MAVLVTGGAGYIGSVAVEQLVAAGEHVCVLDNLTTGYRAAVAAEAEFIDGSILDGTLVRRLLASHPIDTVMHFAAFSIVGESCQDPRKYFENNVTGALSLLSAMLDTGVKQFILSSTAAVYGDPDSCPITEEMPTRPKNPYGLSKRMIEQALEWYGLAYGLRSVALRYFNAAGATAAHGEAHNPESHLIPTVMMAVEGKTSRVSVYGKDYPTPDGTCLRDYIHVADLAEAHLLAMHYLRSGGQTQIINLGNSTGHSVLDVIDTIRQVTGQEVPLAYGPRRDGDAVQLIASSEKARQILGWRPARNSIETIVRDAWQWRQSHPAGYST